MTRSRLSVSMAVGAVLLSGCGSPPGQPRASSVPPTPGHLVDFAALYAENCAGCHGAYGRGGAAIALADPVYLAIVDDATMRERIAYGMRGTSMPAFAQSAGGMLSDKQIDTLAKGIRSSWNRPGVLDGANPPSYTPVSTGDIQRGATVYQIYCERCHGPGGEGGSKASAITNDSFLALISDQGLRTVVITGRPELGAPDWRGNAPGRPPMSEQEVTDVVTWLASHRVAAPGRPYFNDGESR